MLILFSFLDNIVEIVWNRFLLFPLCFIICILVKALYIIRAGLFEACLRLNRFPLAFVILTRSIGRQSFFRRRKRRFFGNRLEILEMLFDLALKLLVVVIVILRGDFVVDLFLMFGLIYVIYGRIDLCLLFCFFVMYHFVHCLIAFLWLHGDLFFLVEVFHLLINFQSLLIVCCHRLILTVLKKILLRFS